MIESGLVPEKKLVDLTEDINSIVAMTVASIKTLRFNKSKTQNLKSKI
jgi:hypothetical protein